MEVGARERALVVDDDTGVLFAVSAMIQDLGFEVDEAQNADSAIKLFETKTYDLVVSDINMPGDIDGIQLARIIRRKNVKQPIILMTGYSERIDDGAREFIVLAKPFGVDEIKNVLK